MLTGRRYLLAFTPEQESYAQRVADICRGNTGLEQRRAYRRRGAVIGYVEQARQLAEAKWTEPWLAEATAHCLQQTLRDLDRACRTHGTWKVRGRSKKCGKVSFRFPDPTQLKVRRSNRRWGAVRLPKFGWVRFRWTRPLGGEIRNATVLRDGNRWYIAFCIEDGRREAASNGKPPVGLDRGVVHAVTCSNGWTRDREFVTPGEAERLKRLQRRLARQQQGSKRRAATKAKLARAHPPPAGRLLRLGGPPAHPSPRPGGRRRPQHHEHDGQRHGHRGAARPERSPKGRAEPGDPGQGLGPADPGLGACRALPRLFGGQGQPGVHVADLPCLRAPRPGEPREPSGVPVCGLRTPGSR